MLDALKAFTRTLTKRTLFVLGISTLATVAAWLAWFQLRGVPMVPITIGVIAFASCFVADVLIRDPHEARRIKVRRWLEMLWDNAALVAVVLAALAVTDYAAPAGQQPQDPATQIVASTLRTAGLTAVLLYGGYLAAASGMSIALVRKTMTAWVVFWSISWLVDAFGDQVARFVRAQPEEALATAIGLFLAFFVCQAGFGSRAPRLHFDVAPATARGMLRRTLLPSARDKRAASVHEAGHVLVHAGLPCVPDTFIAEVCTSLNDGTLGTVSGTHEGEHVLNSRQFAEWQMHVMLAGKVAEETVLGMQMMGAASDYAKWLQLAEMYLANGTRGAFYGRPTTESERVSNREVLLALQETHEKTLHEFFTVNAEVLAELAAALEGRGRLDAMSLRPFLARTVLPPGFPRVAGEVLHCTEA